MSELLTPRQAEDAAADARALAEAPAVIADLPRQP
jgi:hypothetical protein